MHPARAVELTHACVNEGKACLAALPALQLLWIAVPRQCIGFGFKRPAHGQTWVFRHDVVVKLAPDKLADPSVDAVVAANKSSLVALVGGQQAVVSGDSARGEVGGELTGAG